jgi:hypothetical protein
MEGNFAMPKKPWKEPTLDDLLADPILDLLLARDGVKREELLTVVERARRALAVAARARLSQVEEQAGSDVPPPRPRVEETLLCSIR